MLEKLKELIEKIKDIIENGKKTNKKLLESLKYYAFILGEEEIMRYSKESFQKMGEVLGKIETGVATF